MTSEYVSPFQAPGHDGPCHGLKFDPESAEQPAGEGLSPIPIRIVAYEGDGLTLAAGELTPTPETAGDVVAVKRSLATLLRALADELDEQGDADQLEQQAGTEGDDA